MAQTDGGDFARELRSIFETEADERLQALNGHLLTLERSGPDDGSILTEVFREAHSLKGAAAMVELENVAALAHSLETLFGGMQRGEVTADASVFDLIYRALDGVGTLVHDATGGDAASVDVSGLSAALEAASGASSSAPKRKPGRSTARIKREPAATVPRQAPEPQPEPTTPVAVPEATNPLSTSGDDTIRVSTAKLDSLMAHVGELMVTRIGVDQRLTELRDVTDRLDSRVDPVARRRLIELRREIDADGRRMIQVTGFLQDDVRRTRMLPVSTVVDAFPRMVRDLGRAEGKDVELVLRGSDTEVDRAVLERIRTPLTHLLRNAVDHGVELPEVRAAAGKPSRGTISLSASQTGGMLRIDVADDGAGIDPERLRASAVAKGILSEDAARALQGRDVLWLIFTSGLSTRAAVTELSGRGVGLDVVRAGIERLHGLIDVQSEPRRGATFSLTLPLSVATTRCLFVRAGGRTFGVPTTNVVRIVHVRQHEVRRAAGQAVIVLPDGPVTVVTLHDVLDLRSEDDGNDAGVAQRAAAIVLGSAERRAAFMVDALEGTEDVVTKSLPRPLMHVPNLAGATILPSGEVALILNVADLLRHAHRTRGRASSLKGEAREVRTGPPRILIADDSFTTRTLEKNILESAGFGVRVAADGAEAWALLQEEGCDLLISDVQMPEMDGFELTQRIRDDERLKDLPVILVTSLDSNEDRQRGIDAGADAYVIKSAFEQAELLETVERLI
jgi:two-component system chemotaxis sensor kinase CheA